MATKEIKWNIKHVLADGTVLKPGEKLPITPASLACFARYGEIALQAAKRLREKAANPMG